ncbi:MAG: hypothetical protein A4E67_02396 [Syntrophaceae bacterium PtaB.Bin038]|nr:MAG: hypothetical protein A4E67_02396 [Syntrophaceae bacterium PtaB.Bin038]
MLLAPCARLVIVPLPVIPDEVPLKLTFNPSWYPVGAALVLVIVSDCVAASPTCRLVKTMLFDASVGCATWYTLPETLTICEPALIAARPLLPFGPVPSVWYASVTVPLLAPAVAVLTPTLIAVELEPPAIRFITLPPLVVASPLVPLKLALSASE